MTKKHEGRLIVFEEKHDTRIFLVDTDEKLEAVALKILRERDAEGYWFEEPERPAEPMELLLTAEQIAKLPNPERVEAARQQYEQGMQRFKREEAAYLRLRRAIDEGDGKLAVQVLHERQEYEYEGWTFEELEDIDKPRTEE